MSRPSPLFRVDPGWIWIAVGLVTVFVATVVPAQRRLEQDRAELRRLQAAERRTYELLEAHDQFLSDLREGQPSLLRRLAAASLNRMPEGDEAWILSGSIDQNPIAWIDSTIPVESPPPPGRRSLLERLVGGRVGLWSTAFGVFCLFVGLVVGPGTLSPARRRDEGPAWPPAAGPAMALTTLERGTLLVESPRDAGAEDEAAIDPEDLRRWSPRFVLPSDATNDPTRDAPLDQSSEPAIELAIEPAIDAGPTAVPALFEAEAPATVETQDDTVVLGSEAPSESWSEDVEDERGSVAKVVEDATNDHDVEAGVVLDAETIVPNDPTSPGVISADHALVLISSARSESSPVGREDGRASGEHGSPGELPSAVIDPVAIAAESTEFSAVESPRGTTGRTILACVSAHWIREATSYFGFSEEPSVAPRDLLASTFGFDGGATSPTQSNVPTEATGTGLANAEGGIARGNHELEALDGEDEDEDALGDEVEDATEALEDDDGDDDEGEGEDGIEGELDDEAVEDEPDSDPPIIELHVDQGDADPVNAGEPLDPPWQDDADRR